MDFSLSSHLSVLQLSDLQRFLLDKFPLSENRVTPTEVLIGEYEIVEALVAPMIESRR